jgi:MYXO-CTERM domain-containing protein
LGWGIDTNNDFKTMEYWAVVNGIESNGPDGKPDQVEWRYNSTPIPDVILDEAETLVARYPATEPTGNARVVSAPSNFGGTPDYFIDWAIPISVFRTPPAGFPAVPAGTAMRFACGSSSDAKRMDADPAAGPGATTLTDIISDPLFCDSTGCYSDRDFDGVPDATEITLGTNPANPDSDGDGIRDNVELSATGSGVGPFTKVDTDGDGTIDALDLDSDGDGHGDSIETAIDSDGDGTGNWRDLDSDNDCRLDKDETVAGLRDPSVPSTSPSMNCTAPLTCDTTSGTCVDADAGTDAGSTDTGGGGDTGAGGDTDLGDSSSIDGGGGDGSSTDSADDGSVTDGSGDGSSTDGGSDGSVTDGGAGDGSTTDGGGGDGTTTTDGGDDTSGDGAADTSVGDTTIGDDTGTTIDTGVVGDGAADGDSINPLNELGTLEGGGCSCTTPANRGDVGLVAIAATGLALALARRRRR